MGWLRLLNVVVPEGRVVWWCCHRMLCCPLTWDDWRESGVWVAGQVEPSSCLRVPPGWLTGLLESGAIACLRRCHLGFHGLFDRMESLS